MCPWEKKNGVEVRELSDDRPMWDRQPNETSKAYEAFCTYLRLGSERSVPQVGRELNKNYSHVYKWYYMWSWDKRAASYDSRLNQEMVEDSKRQIRLMNQKHTEVASQMVEKLSERLLQMDLDELESTSMSSWLREAVKVERLARGLPSDRTETSTLTWDDAEQLAASLNKLLSDVMQQYVPAERHTMFRESVEYGLAAIFGQDVPEPSQREVLDGQVEEETT